MYDKIFVEEDLFPREITSYEERDYGILFYNEQNKDSYDSNHALIYKEKICDIKSVLEDITKFYKEKGIRPIIYESAREEGFFEEIREELNNYGFETWFEVQNYMVLSDKNIIEANQNIDVKIVPEWNEEYGIEIFEKAGESYGIDVVKKALLNSNTVFFVAFYKDRPVGMTYCHVTDGVCRVDYLLVSKEARNIGVGRAIINRFVEYCNENAFEFCYLWPDGETAQKIYYEAGFRCVQMKNAGRAVYNDKAMEILSYAKNNIASFEKGAVSSNQIYFFDFDEKKYILKTPLMVGDNLSPFWSMMKNVFSFSFEKQNTHLDVLYNVLKDNPHIKVVPFVAADNEAMIYEYMQGDSIDFDEFPKGNDNAYKLGKYVGYNHQVAHENCGIIGIEDVTDFYSRVLSHIEECIHTYWNSEESIDKKVRLYFETLKESNFTSSKYSLIMVDGCADQFLYEGENIVSCVDLDAYVIGPVEWELSFLKLQVEDWDSFKNGYELYQKMPAFEETSKLFFFIMALNAYWDKEEMERILENNDKFMEVQDDNRFI